MQQNAKPNLSNSATALSALAVSQVGVGNQPQQELDSVQGNIQLQVLVLQLTS